MIMQQRRDHRLVHDLMMMRMMLAILVFVFVWIPTPSLAASAASSWNIINDNNGSTPRSRRLAQNRQPGFVNDVYHCSNPQIINAIESDVFCDYTTFQWDLSLLDPTSPPVICFGANYTQIHAQAQTPAGISDVEKPCYWWDLMYGSLAPSMTPSTSPPSMTPSISPSMTPSISPSMSPSLSPSMSPSLSPSTSPSLSPTLSPTIAPSFSPSLTPSDLPTTIPSQNPTFLPTSVPSFLPSNLPLTLHPSTLHPSTSKPTTSKPTTSKPTTSKPTKWPTLRPVVPATLRPTTMKPHSLPTAAPLRQTVSLLPTLKPSSPKPFFSSSSLKTAKTIIPSSSGTTWYPTITAIPTGPVTTITPTWVSTVDRSDVLVRPLANFVIAFYSMAEGTSGHHDTLQLRGRRRNRHLLAVNRYQLTGITANFLIQQLRIDFPKCHVKTMALVLTSVSAQVAVDHNSTTNTSSTSSNFQEALSGEVVFGTTNASVVPPLSDLYASIQNSFTDSLLLKKYSKLLRTSKDPVLRQVSRVELIQGSSQISTTTTDPASNTTTSSTAAENNAKQGGVKWNVGLIAIVAGAGVAALFVAILVYLCLTHKSRKRRRRLRRQQQQQDKERSNNDGAPPTARGGAVAGRPASLDSTSPDAKTLVASNKSRRWFSWGGRNGNDGDAPDLTLQPTASANSSPLSAVTTPRSKPNSPAKVSTTNDPTATNKNNNSRNSNNPFDEIASDDGDDDYYRNAADEEDRSEVTSTYSYIESNTNDDHSLSVAPSFLYGANETGSIMGDFDDFGELVGNATKQVQRTPWIDDMSLPGKSAPWSKKAPSPARATSIGNVFNSSSSNNKPPPRPAPSSTIKQQAMTQEPDNSHILNISGSYGSFYQYDDKKGIMMISRPSDVADTSHNEDEMPSKIGGSFLLEDSFLTQDGSQTDGLGVAGGSSKNELSILDSPAPGMDSGSLFLPSPSTTVSTTSPIKSTLAARIRGETPTSSSSTKVDDSGIGHMLQFYEGTSRASANLHSTTNTSTPSPISTNLHSTTTTSTPSPIKTTKIAFDEVWRDIVGEDMDDHVRDTTAASTTPNQGRSPAKQEGDSDRVNPSLSQRLNRSDASLRTALTPSPSQRSVSKETLDDRSLNSSSSRLNRSDASLRMALTPTQSQTNVSNESFHGASPNNSYSERLNRSDASLRLALTPTRSQNLVSNESFGQQTSPTNNSAFHRSDDSLRMALTPTGSRRMTPSKFDTDDVDSDVKNTSRVSFSPNTSTKEASPSTQASTGRPVSDEVATRRWLANQNNDQRSDNYRQSRSKSVAPSGPRQRASGLVSPTKRSSSLPPSRHSALNRVREELPFDEEVKYMQPTVQQIDEGSDEGGTKFSI